MTSLPEYTERHSVYDAIDPEKGLQNSAQGQTVFISGASRGIGQATAVAFARAGAEAIFLTARSEASLQKTRSLVEQANPNTRCQLSACEVTDPVSTQDAVSGCVNAFGGIDTLISAAGVLAPWKKLADTDVDEWWRTWEVNVKGSYLVCKYALPHVIQSAKHHQARGVSRGHVVLYSSVGAQFVMEGASDYQISKHAINRLCQFIQNDHGVEGVKCFAIHPGGVATELGLNLPEALHENLQDDPSLGAGFAVWLASGKGDWAKGRYLSANWDVADLLHHKDQIIREDLYVNTLRGIG